MSWCAKWQQKFGYPVEAPNNKHQKANKFQMVQIPNRKKAFGSL
jgi:hypothetical protein